MADISAAAVKSLREETGLGMMECKKALQESNGDVPAAKDLLRKRFGNTAAEKAGRATKEGMVAVCVAPDRKSAAMVEVNCETDFCARNEEFQAMVKDIASMAASFPAGEIQANAAITDRVQGLLAKIRENMGYARGVKIAAGKVSTYVHHNGKVGVVLGVDGEVSDETMQDICMHIAFANPLAITPEQVPADLVEKEKTFAISQAMDSGKPKDIAEKMVTGKIRKFLEANALVEQAFVRDDTKKVKDILGQAKIVAFARYAVGA